MIIPYGRQTISQEDIDAVTAVLRSEFLTQGPVVPRFESELAAYCRAEHAVATNSATSALHLACLALGVGPGDRVWTTPITFVASANCARYCGADVDFVDIDPLTYNMSADRLEEKLIAAESAGRLPKVVIPVHLCGQSCDMERIHALSQHYGFRTIEDASHAIGGRYLNQPIGGCAHSEITVFSFHPVKIITTGEGGAATTNDPNLADTMQRLRSHGITRDPAQMTNPPDGPWYYQQIDLGFNYRLTDMQAALGLSQLRRLDQYVNKRHSLAKEYDQLLRDKPVVTPFQHPDCFSSFHLYVVRLQLGEMRVGQREIFERLRSNGIMVNLHYIPLYRQPYYSKSNSYIEYPEAEQYYKQAITLPLYPTLDSHVLENIVDVMFTPIGHQTIF
ncbi:MAG: UDP-4-amino-4,6-dideoxy-N-acetyl-beta-L-altrosamine transaminase [Sulfuritalea sp.]|nr:UDP-4-amino-4,6-dideoxy-N-acetyl-beta-L-altrosamine transaminase [Sulfuritalea sp.]